MAGASLSIATPTEAQVGALLSVYSDYRLRGVSVSGGRPVGLLDVSYDLPTGFYSSLSGRTVLTGHDGVQPLGFAANAGYATRLHGNLAADAGIVHSRYSHYSGLGSARAYTEFYAGLAGRLLGVRLSISPDYLGTTRWTAYGEVDGHLDVSRRTVIEGSVGVLSPIGVAYGANHRPQVDGRLGISQKLGSVTLRAAIVSRTGDYLDTVHSKPASTLLVGASTAL